MTIVFQLGSLSAIEGRSQVHLLIVFVLYIYIYMSIYVYVYVYVCVCVCVYIYICIYIYIHDMDMYTCVFQCMQNDCLFMNYCWRHVFLPPNRFCIFLMLHTFASFETAKKPNETAKKPDETAKPKCGNWNGEKNWKQRKFRQPAIIIAVSDFER